MRHPLVSVLLVSFAGLANSTAEASRYPYQSCFEVASRLHDVPLDLLLAVAATESAWDPDARSHANAHGIMQIQWPGTARHLGVTRVSELYNPCLNIELGSRYLRELIDRNDGDVTRALASYNYGPSRIESLAALPAGANRYVELVAGQRQRILQQSAGSRATAVIAADGVMRFDHAARARGYADTLNARINSARFTWSDSGDGFVVAMQVGDDGLSFADRTLLEDLGWPATQEAP
jgi:soluble lytic murein transglycosylase-like protein